VKEEEYESRRKEYVGDALLSFVAREVLCTDWKHRKKQREVECALMSNQSLERIGKKIGLKPIEDSGHNKQHKKYACAVEIKLYEVYLDCGIEGAKDWFKQNILSNYNKLQKE